MTKKYFLKVPVEGKERFKYVPVDVSRLNRGILTEIYESRFDEHTGGCQYKPVVGAELFINQNLDVSPLKESLEELLGQIREVLSVSYDEAGLLIYAKLIEGLDFASVIEALGKEKLDQANEALRLLLYTLMGGVCDLARTLHQLQTHDSGVTVALDAMDTTLRESGGITSQFYLQWSEAADNLNQAVSSLQEIEKDLNEVMQRIESARNQWKGELTEENPVIHCTLKYLDQSAESFMIRAFEYLKQPKASSNMEAVVVEARDYITRCRGLQTRAHTEWQGLRTLVSSQVLPKQSMVDALCRSLEEGSKLLSDFRSRFQKGTALPYEIPSAIIIREEYERAEKLLKDPNWSPLAAQRRVGGKITSILSFLQNAPALPASVKEVLLQAEQYIARLEEYWQETVKAETVETIPAVTTLVVPASHQRPASTVDSQRLQELYELIICVGYVLTSKASVLSGSNTRAMLRVVQHLGRCGPEEVQDYRLPLNRFIKSEGRCEEIARLNQLIPRWRQSKALWLRYEIKNNRVPADRTKLKLTQSATELVEQLMAKHHLTPAQIQVAHRQRREEQLQAFKKFQATDQ